MADGPVAGSIFLEFKAEVEQVNRALGAMNAKLDQLGAKGEQMGQKVQSGATKATAGFDQIDRATIRTTAAIARVTSRLISLQLAIGALTTAFGNLGPGVQAATVGISTFAAFAATAKTKMDLFAAGIIGAAVALVSFTINAIESSIKATDRMTNATDKGRLSAEAYDQAIKDATKSGEAFGTTYGQRLAKELEIARAAFDRNEKRLREISQDRTKIREELGGGKDDRLEKLIQTLNTEEDRLRLQQGDLQKRGLGTAALADIGKTVDELVKLREALDTVAIVGAHSVKVGLITPVKEAENNLKAYEDVLAKLLQQNAEVDRLLNTPGLTPEQKNELLSRRPSTSIGPAQEDVETARRKLVQAQAPAKFAETFATPFAQGIADGLVRGIQDGKDAMETLAGVGENLFGNFLAKSADGFVDLMTKGFTAIAGAGGDILGNLFTGLAGVAGFFLSGKGKGKGSSSFDAVADVVTSTQEVRGIVAGPTSIPIAQVGDNLSAAVVPVVEGIQSLAAILSDIRGILSRGGGGSGRSAGFVGAPTA